MQMELKAPNITEDITFYLLTALQTKCKQNMSLFALSVVTGLSFPAKLQPMEFSFLLQFLQLLYCIASGKVVSTEQFQKIMSFCKYVKEMKLLG